MANEVMQSARGTERDADDEAVLTVRGLRVEFGTDDGAVHAVNGVDFDVRAGETLGIVGESGSGKSVTVMSMLGLLPTPPARIIGGEALYRGVDLLQLSKREMSRYRGKRLSMIFQDPMTSLNPVLKVGYQIEETLQVHDPGMSRQAAHRRAVELLDLVGVPDASRRAGQFPHEFSGGMRQRAMIAVAIANQPDVLIADEPTTALDVTIQAQVIEVLRTAQRETGAAMILITHDLGVIAEMADRVNVMYGGRVVESGTVRDIFYRPSHPYTVGLIGSLARLDTDLQRLAPIPGQPPNMLRPPSGCAFNPRCRMSSGRARCTEEIPRLQKIAEDHQSACHFAAEVADEHERVLGLMGLAARDA